MYKLLATAITAGALLGAAGTAAAAITPVASTFDSNTEGWQEQTRGPGANVGSTTRLEAGRARVATLTAS